jgi:hypothetical protein
MFAVELTKPVFEEGTFDLSEAQRVGMRVVLSEVGERVVAYLQSLTSEMRPPTRAGGAERAAHPGHWADVTGLLASNYKWRVEDTASGVQLVLENDTPYAIYLEEHDGFFVLRGVADAGGPVDRAMREVVPDVMPDWDIRLG